MKCNVVRDLFPLYFDGLCSEETRKQLEEHLDHCETCRQLRQNLEAEQEWHEEKPEWDPPIVPLKKVRKKIHRKNILIGVCLFFLLLFMVCVSLLTYGQINKKGISFETIYDAARFRYIGKQFASGNIDPLYEVLDDGYLLQDQESSAVRLAYTDNEEYDRDMKEAILAKYHQYFDNKGLTYKGIEEIGYCETPKMGWNRTLSVALKFEGEDQMEYYIILYKTLNGLYLADDYFGNPYLAYTDNKDKAEPESGYTETYHTDDTLFSCLPDKLNEFDLCTMRYMVLASGQRALQGDKFLVENGQLWLRILSEQDLTDGTDFLQQKANEELVRLSEQGFYLTDITWIVKEYDKTRHLYKYQIVMELTQETDLEKITATLDCYRISGQFIYISGMEKL